ncbi:amino acid adenylation domain-containing protein [Nocardia sp. NPDC060256]|uniref:amino acid adenylation domain-containing protein n=1 Tax=unclassified Nocardia TaxID=2637762 RepID=UPI0036636158
MRKSQTAPSSGELGAEYESLWNQSLAELFAAQAEAHPDWLAVDAVEHRFTYGELSEKAERFARGLHHYGVSAGEVVGVLGPRCAETVMAFLGVLYAGASFMPVDLSLPDERIRGMLEDSEPTAMIRVPGVGELCDNGVRVLEFDDVLIAGDDSDRLVLPGAVAAAVTPAYVMFTSGSTGRPKAIPAPQRGVARAAVANGFMNMRGQERVLHASSLSFDISTLEIWATLLNGGCLVPIPSQILLVPEEFHTLIQRQQIDTVWLTTSIFHHIAQERPQAFATVRYLAVCGEVLDPDAVRRVFDHGRPEHLLNGYGPTEATTFATCYEVEDLAPDAATVPIGRPIADTVVHVLRNDGTVADPGEEGELFIGGGGVASGYLNNPGETAGSFCTRTLRPGDPPQHLYRTGDFGLRRPDGILEFCGRRDDQVKVRGFRIELAEIRAAVADHPDVADACVFAREDGLSRYLAAYVSLRTPNRPVTDMDLRAYLSGRLPHYMVPATITVIDRLPLTSTGKVDRLALLQSGGAVAAEDSAPPRSTREAVAQVWASTLPGSRGEDSENFIACGGNSLLAAQLVIRLERNLQLGSKHSFRLVNALLAEPTLQGFTTAVERVMAGSTTVHAPVDRWRPDLDWDMPSVLATTPAPTWQAPKHVLLTGATGFLGSYMLRALLDRSDADIHVVVRARNEQHARHRVIQAQLRRGLTRPVPADRIHPILGDLGRPRLGMSEQEWEHQASHADLIHHCGAHVNYIYPYEQLRAANVESTRELIRLAARRAVPLHYISSVVTVEGVDTFGLRHITEDTPMRDNVQLLSWGYSESKWVSEQLLFDAAANGLPTAIYRAYDISGDSATSNWDTNGVAVTEFFQIMVETGLAPIWDLPMNLVPVDYCANAAIHLSLTQPAQGQAYHLINPHETTLSDMIDRFRAHGHTIRDVSYHDWTDAVSEHLTKNPAHPWGPFHPLFTNLAAFRDALTVAETYDNHHFPALDVSRIQRDLHGSGITCRPDDHDLLDQYIRYFHTTGFISPPATG